MVKRWRDVGVLCIGRANAVKRAPSSANKEVAVGVHVKRSGIGRVGNINRSLPGDAAVGGPAEFSDVASEEAGPKLVLEPMPCAVGLIYGEPLLVASVRASVG